MKNVHISLIYSPIILYFHRITTFRPPLPLPLPSPHTFLSIIFCFNHCSLQYSLSKCNLQCIQNTNCLFYRFNQYNCQSEHRIEINATNEPFYIPQAFFVLRCIALKQNCFSKVKNKIIFKIFSNYYFRLLLNCFYINYRFIVKQYKRVSYSTKVSLKTFIGYANYNYY